MSRPWDWTSRDDTGSEYSDLYVWKPIPRRTRVKGAIFAFVFGSAFTAGVFALVGWRGGMPWGAVVQVVLVFMGIFALVAAGLYVQWTFTGKRVDRYLDDSDKKS